MTFKNIKSLDFGKPLRNIISWGAMKKTSVMPMYPWEKEFGIASLTHSRSYASINKDLDEKRTKAAFAYWCLKNYCEHTSLHGLQFITDEKSYKVERAFWLICCCCALIGAILFLNPFFTKYSEAHILTNVESTGVPIWNVPFPAVTICNVNKAAHSYIKRAAQFPPWSNYHVEILEEVVDVMAQMGQIPVDEIHDFHATVKEAIDTHTAQLDKLMKNMIQRLDRMIVRCWWVGRDINCSKIFRLKRTDEGYCWGFNSKNMRDLTHIDHNSLEDVFYDTQDTNSAATDSEGTSSGDEKANLMQANSMNSFAAGKIFFHHSTDYTENWAADPELKPLLVHGSGPNMGLTVLMNPDAEEYFANTNNFHGFKVLIHNPLDFPSISTKGFLANAGREIFAAVSASKTLSTEAIRNIPQNKRNCLFANEMKLNYYSSYSHTNCLLDCKVSAMKKTCNCTPYIYALMKNMTLCKYNGVMCINNNTRKFSSIEPKGELTEELDAMKCTCPNNCDETIYNPEVTTASFPVKPEDIHLPHGGDDINMKKLVLLRVFFKELGFVQYRRDLLYSWNDLIAAFGGIVGLFIGFSFVSGLELIFFFIVRPIIRWSSYFKIEN